MKNVVTITGIRPDFIRMSEIFKKLDERFNHTLIHTGQHFDFNLSDVFFKDLAIRKPDFNLNIGSMALPHYEFEGALSSALIKLLNTQEINPDIILFLGDSNSVLCSVPLKKEKYKIGHIESGMRSHDLRMFEEINRKVCDTVSDYCFVYHENYKQNLINEGKSPNSVFNVGNTITEVVMKYRDEFKSKAKSLDFILLDIHRPENFQDDLRLKNIIKFAESSSDYFNLPVKMLDFKRTTKAINEAGIVLDKIKLVPLMGFRDYMSASYNAKLIISDSGTAQEEPSFFKTPVLVPRDYTERPESVHNSCSIMVNVNEINYEYFDKIFEESQHLNFVTDWLGDGRTSDSIADILAEIL
jgi:UDP-N-acetylglucosamine 2-epimerase (non-hydrolysing)